METYLHCSREVVGSEISVARTLGIALPWPVLERDTWVEE